MGSYDRDFFAQQDVEIEAHNLSALPAKIAVDFYFVGRPEYRPEPRILFSKRTFTIDVLPRYQKRVSLKSDVLRSSEQRYVALNEQDNSGYQIAGWFFQASVPNDRRVFASASSEPAWIERMDWFALASARFEAAAGKHASGSDRKSESPFPSPSVTATQSTEALSQHTVERHSVPPHVPTVILTSDIAVQLKYGRMTLHKGTKLPVISRTKDFVSVYFGSEVIEIPVTDTQPN